MVKFDKNVQRAMNRRRLPKYAADVVNAASNAPEPGFYVVTVRHDSWCDLLNDKGPCNCNPITDPNPKRQG